MIIKKSEFIISAVKREQYPIDGRNEIAFVGRSNVGKSSIINALTNRRKLAKVSQTPGKTRLINFFLINDDFYLVDLPGYGYAKVSKKEKESWGKTIEMYLTDREELKRVILLVDSRHKPTADDIMMYEWIKHFGYNCVVIATKADKISRGQYQKHFNIIRKKLQLEKDEKIISINEDLNRKANEIQSLIEENKKIEYNYKIEVSNLNKKTIITTTTHMKLDKDFLLIDEDFNIENLKKILQKNNLIKIGKAANMIIIAKTNP